MKQFCTIRLKNILIFVDNYFWRSLVAVGVGSLPVLGDFRFGLERGGTAWSQSSKARSFVFKSALILSGKPLRIISPLSPI